MASFPSATKTFTTRSNGDTITPAFFNEPGDEITAIETFLRSSLFSSVNSSGLPITASYTPVWGNSGTANTTTGSTITGSYIQMGKLVFFKLKLTWGGGTAAGSGTWTFTLPVTADSDGAPSNMVTTMVDSSASAQYRGITATLSTSAFGVYLFGTTGGNAAGAIAAVSGTVPFTWATGDSLSVSGWYFAA